MVLELLANRLGDAPFLLLSVLRFVRFLVFLRFLRFLLLLRRILSRGAFFPIRGCVRGGVIGLVLNYFGVNDLWIGDGLALRFNWGCLLYTSDAADE